MHLGMLCEEFTSSIIYIRNA